MTELCSDCLCKKCLVRAELRRVFSEHSFYTFLYITSFYSEEFKTVEKRLLHTANEIANVFLDYIGQPNVDKLTEILTEHIKLAGDSVSAVFNSTSIPVESISTNCYSLANFLNSINPDYNIKEISSEFYHHTWFIIQLSTARLYRDWETEIELFDTYYSHMMKFSDLIASPL